MSDTKKESVAVRTLHELVREGEIAVAAAEAEAKAVRRGLEWAKLALRAVEKAEEHAAKTAKATS